MELNRGHNAYCLMHVASCFIHLPSLLFMHNASSLLLNSSSETHQKEGQNSSCSIQHSWSVIEQSNFVRIRVIIRYSSFVILSSCFILHLSSFIILHSYPGGAASDQTPVSRKQLLPSQSIYGIPCTFLVMRSNNFSGLASCMDVL